MMRGIAGITKITGVLAMAGAVIVVAALPAAAAAPNQTYGAAASGPISASPLGRATFPGTSPVTVPNVNIAGLLTTRESTSKAGPTSGSSRVATIDATLVATLSARASLTAKAVESSCTFNTTTGKVSGTATITHGRVHVVGKPVIKLAEHPARNTEVSVHGIAKITLNKHSTGHDGTLTVTAIYVSLLGGTQTLSLGTSVCNAANLEPVPMLPGSALPLTLGGLGALLVAGAGYRVTRRSRLAAAA